MEKNSITLPVSMPRGVSEVGIQRLWHGHTIRQPRPEVQLSSLTRRRDTRTELGSDAGNGGSRPETNAPALTEAIYIYAAWAMGASNETVMRASFIKASTMVDKHV